MTDRRTATTDPSATQNADGTSFSSRWGISLPDGGYTSVPNFLFEHYAEAGVTRMEFLTILHLARYQFERRGSECRPSVGTVARQMGCSVRTIQRTLTQMEERGLLVRHHRAGRTTIYDFSGFSRAVLEVAVGSSPATGDVHVTPDTCVTPTPDTCVTPPLTHVSPEEEHEEKQTGNVGGELTKEQNHTIARLVEIGVTKSVAQRLARESDPSDVRGWVDYAKSANGLSDPAAFVVRQLLDREPAPSERGNRRVTGWRDNSQERRRRYASQSEIQT